MPITGALAGALPLRLGGDQLTGWTAAQHARVCADLVALQRVQPLASWRYTQTGSGPSDATITTYAGRNGVGLAWAPTATVPAQGACDFVWDPELWRDPYTNEILPVVARAALATTETVIGAVYAGVTLIQGTIRVVAADDTLSPVNTNVNVTVWGTVGSPRAIGDYGGDPNKEDSTTEGRFPYSEFLLKEFQSQRGTAYTKETGTLVDCENVALARYFAAVGPRNAEKFRANCVPGRSDERLPYWEKLLAVPKRLNEPKWRTRQKLAAHYRLSEGATVGSLRTALQELLGDAFVDLSWDQGVDLDNPPAQTFWPGVNPGSSSLSLGGGAWTSSRCVLRVEVTRPSNMSVSDFQTLMDVELHALLDQMLPAWATWTWFLTDDDGGGFFLDVSQLDFTGLTDG